MRSRPFATFDPWKFASTGQTLEGSLPLARLERLAGALQSAEGEARYRLTGRVDADGRSLLEAEIDADVLLECQRCLGPVRTALHAHSTLAPIADDGRAAALPGAYEPLVVGEEGVVPADVVEDELILTLPLVAMHDTLHECEACGYVVPQPATTTVGEAKPNPFAALPSLLKESKTQE